VLPLPLLVVLFVIAVLCEARDPRFLWILFSFSIAADSPPCDSTSGGGVGRAPAVPGLGGPLSVYGTCRPGATPRPGTEVLSKALLACPSDSAGANCGSLLFDSCSSLIDFRTAMMVPQTVLLLCCCLLAFPPPGTDIFLNDTYSVQCFSVVAFDW